MQETILRWYKKNKRDLPWRKTTDPYAILVSEIMLQQTQVDRVIAYYKRFLNTFPDFFSLARANEKTLLQLWSGLGYNSRALRLKQLAKTVVKKYNGQLPKTQQELLTLPGIGPYTAHAILAFAFNKEFPVVDTNIRRILVHELGLNEDLSEDALRQYAKECIPKKKSRIWHNALMDYGSLVLSAKKTGIKPLSQQSQFQGSDRQVRGFIIKHLTTHLSLSKHTLKKNFPQKNISLILAKLQKENIVQLKQNKITLQTSE